MLHGAGIFTNIYPINEPNVDKYTIPGAWSIWVFLNRQLGYLSFCGTRYIVAIGYSKYSVTVPFSSKHHIYLVVYLPL